MANFTPQQIEQFLQEFFDVVGARQYVGARYVPIFGRAGEDTVEWDDGAPYEPLTVVMHLGVSYVSRRYVPRGIQITDTDYWVETYRFNAQVEQYRQEVLGFQGQIDHIREDMESDYVPFPDPDTYPKYGTTGQVLTTLTDGGTKWEDPVTVTADVAEPLIESWLDEHPEATTTVQDGSITAQKLNASLDNLIHESRGLLPSISTDAELMALPEGTYIVNNQSYTTWVPTTIKSGTLIVFKTNPVNATGFGLMIWNGQESNEIHVRTFICLAGTPPTYTWYGTWESQSIPKDGSVTAQKLNASLANLIQESRGWLPSVSTDAELMALPQGVYALNLSSYNTWVPTTMKSGTLIIFKTNTVNASGFGLMIWNAQESNEIYVRTFMCVAGTPPTYTWYGTWENPFVPQRLDASLDNLIHESRGWLPSMSTDAELMALPEGTYAVNTTHYTSWVPTTIKSGTLIVFKTNPVNATGFGLMIWNGQESNEIYVRTFLCIAGTPPTYTWYGEWLSPFYSAKFSGEKCACYGDSITWYDGHEYDWGKFSGDTAVGYESWLRGVLKLTVYNRGISGATAPSICASVRSASDFDTIDFVTLTSGANDERHNTPLGTLAAIGGSFDTTTFYGAFQSAIEHVLGINPACKIILCTPIQGFIYANGYDSEDYPDHPSSGVIRPVWAEAIRDIAAAYSLPVCDWYAESGLNLATRDLYYNDPEPPTNTLYSLHPDDAGFERMAEILVSTFKKVSPL